MSILSRKTGNEDVQLVAVSVQVWEFHCEKRVGKIPNSAAGHAEQSDSEVMFVL